MVWEVMSSGELPYGEMASLLEVTAHVKAGNVLKKPQDCSNEVYNDLMAPCWLTFDERPTFAALVNASGGLCGSQFFSAESQLTDEAIQRTESNSAFGYVHVETVSETKKNKKFQGVSIHHLDTKLLRKVVQLCTAPFLLRDVENKGQDEAIRRLKDKKKTQPSFFLWRCTVSSQPAYGIAWRILDTDGLRTSPIQVQRAVILSKDNELPGPLSQVTATRDGQKPVNYHLLGIAVVRLTKVSEKSIEDWLPQTEPWIEGGDEYPLPLNGQEASVAAMVRLVGKPASENTICPRDGKRGCAYVDTLTRDDDVGPATTMLSYSWGSTLGHIVTALKTWAIGQNMDPRSVKIWMCSLCLNQHRMVVNQTPEQLQSEFGSRVAAIGHILPFIDP